MPAEYDGEANALQILLRDAEPSTDGTEVAGLHVAYAGDAPAGIEVLYPDAPAWAARPAPRRWPTTWAWTRRR